MENYLINTIKENLGNEKEDKVFIIDPLTSQYELFFTIDSSQYLKINQRLELYFSNSEKINLFLCEDLQYINFDFFINNQLVLTIELNFRNEKKLKNIIEDIKKLNDTASYKLRVIEL